jgi:TonB family protein
LLGTSAAGWAALPGSGAERDGAIGAGLARAVTPRPIGTAAATAAAPPGTLPLAQLSRKPVPPPLAGALERNYPAAARKQGQGGDAKVRARVEPTGEVRQVTITSESSQGFGEACRRTLLASKWTAPLSDAGRPVATWVSYRCKFRVDN